MKLLVIGKCLFVEKVLDTNTVLGTFAVDYLGLKNACRAPTETLSSLMPR